MNAKIGSPDFKGTPFHQTTNRNGQVLLYAINECEMLNLSAKYTKRLGKLWTFTYPNGSKAQLGHILVNKKLKISALNCEVCNGFHSICSDHRAGPIKVRLSLQANKIKKTKKIPYDWSKLKDDEQVMRKYTVDIVNRFQVLQNLNDDDQAADSMYKNIVEANKTAAETHIPLKPKQIRHVLRESSDVTNKR